MSWEDRAAHDALSRRGGAARRPSRRLRQGEIVALARRGADERARATEIRYRRDRREVVVETHEPTKTLHELTGEALAGGVELEGLEVLKPSLEDIYLDLTGDQE